MMVELKKAELTDIPLIRTLSESIWKQHYITIITLEQIEYMLAKMYSNEKLSEEILNPDYTYYLAMLNGTPCGYIAISSNDEKKFMLHKFYILQNQRFKGLGETIFKLVFTARNYEQIQLFVNRQNFKSVNFYFKMGFKIFDVVDNHFGDGYYMNDFIMIKKRN